MNLQLKGKKIHPVFGRIFALAYRNYVFSVRNISAVMEVLFWPVIGIVSIGMMGSFLKVNEQMLAFLLTGAIMSGVLQVVQLDVAFGFLYDVWSKSLKQTLMSPVSSFEYVIGPWLFSMIKGTAAFVFLSLLSLWWFKFYLPPPFTFILSFGGVMLSGLIVGMSVIFFLVIFGSRIDVVAWMISVLMMLICGIYYPVTMLPSGVAFIAKLIPLTYFLEYFRTGYGFPLNFAHPLIKGYGLSFLYIAVLFFLIETALLRARKTGMIVRLSE